MDNLKFWTVCASNGIVLTKEKIAMLERYAGELLYWNEKINLISRKDIDNIYERHIMHSLSILKYFEPKPKAKCLDIGTGGGLPGIPIKIAVPDIDMLMIDSIGKKIKMTDMFANHTDLKKIKAMKIRAEELAEQQEFSNYFDVIFSRAVAPTIKLIDWSKKMLKNDGKFVFLKGGDLNDEINEAKDFYKKLSVREIQIQIKGFPWFEDEAKKILICSFDK